MDGPPRTLVSILSVSIVGWPVCKSALNFSVIEASVSL
jgi:hypothetical protein